MRNHVVWCGMPKYQKAIPKSQTCVACARPSKDKMGLEALQSARSHNMKVTSALVLMLAIPVSAGAGDTQGVAFDDGNEGGGGGVPKAVWTRRLGLQFHDGCQEEAAVLRWVSR